MKPANVLFLFSDEHDPRYMGCSGQREPMQVLNGIGPLWGSARDPKPDKARSIAIVGKGAAQ